MPPTALQINLDLRNLEAKRIATVNGQRVTRTVDSPTCYYALFNMRKLRHSNTSWLPHDELTDPAHTQASGGAWRDFDRLLLRSPYRRSRGR
jgi:hypothetical protein